MPTIFSGFGGDYDFNQATLVGYPQLTTNQRKPFFNKFGWTQNFRYYGSDASNNFHSMQLKAEKRFSNGYSLLSHYTMLGAFIAAYLIIPIREAYGWRMGFFVPSALGVVWAAAWWMVYRQPEDHPRLGLDHRFGQRTGKCKTGKWQIFSIFLSYIFLSAGLDGRNDDQGRNVHSRLLSDHLFQALHVGIEKVIVRIGEMAAHCAADARRPFRFQRVRQYPMLLRRELQPSVAHTAHNADEGEKRVGGWSLQGIYNWRTGIVGNVKAARDLIGNGKGEGTRPDQMGRRIAFLFIRALGSHALGLSYALVGADALLATFVPSTTARSGGIIFPVATSLSEAFDSRPGETSRRLGAFLMELVYQCDAVVCAMFLTGQVSNPLIVKFVAQAAGVELSYGA